MQTLVNYHSSLKFAAGKLHFSILELRTGDQPRSQGPLSPLGTRLTGDQHLRHSLSRSKHGLSKLRAKKNIEPEKLYFLCL